MVKEVPSFYSEVQNPKNVRSHSNCLKQRRYNARINEYKQYWYQSKLSDVDKIIGCFYLIFLVYPTSFSYKLCF